MQGLLRQDRAWLKGKGTEGRRSQNRIDESDRRSKRVGWAGIGTRIGRGPIGGNRQASKASSESFFVKIGF
eukprot:2672417-Pyramimonas_sp.AAC.1